MDKNKKNPPISINIGICILVYMEEMCREFNKGDIFEDLIKYHCTTNLAACRPYIKDGQILDNESKPLQEGSDLKTPHEGLLILRNGSTLLDKLVNSGRVHTADIDAPVKLNTEEDFYDFLTFREENDGVYVYESQLNQMRRVGYIVPPNGASIDDSLPSDFVYQAGCDSATQRLKLGTKTRIALELTAEEGAKIQAFQIKRSSFGHLGMGKVTHINEQGLAREFYLEHQPDYTGHFIDEEQGIVGIYKTYRKENGPLELAEEGYVHFEDGEIQYIKKKTKTSRLAEEKRNYCASSIAETVSV